MSNWSSDCVGDNCPPGLTSCGTLCPGLTFGCTPRDCVGDNHPPGLTFGCTSPLPATKIV